MIANKGFFSTVIVSEQISVMSTQNVTHFADNGCFINSAGYAPNDVVWNAVVMKASHQDTIEVRASGYAMDIYVNGKQQKLNTAMKYLHRGLNHNFTLYINLFYFYYHMFN